MAPVNHQTAIFQAQIDNLGERLDKGVDEIKALLRPFDERLRLVETHEVACRPMVNVRLDAAVERLNEHDMAIKSLSKLVDELAQTNRILKWLLGVFTAILIALVIALATGQLQVVAQ